MKNLFHKIMSIAMALLLLASTTSWTVDKHFCMGHLVDISFFSDAEGCGMDLGAGMEGMEMECCNNETIVVDGIDDLKLSFDELSLDHQAFMIAFTSAYIELFIGLPEQIIPHNDYPPPLLIRDLQLLDQVFLI